MPGVTLPAQRPLNLLCKRGDGGHSSQARVGAGPARFTCAQLLQRASQDLAIKACSPSKHFTSRCVLAFKLQFPEGASPPQHSLCGNGGNTKNLVSGRNPLPRRARGRGQFPHPFSLPEDVCPQPTAPFSATTAPVRRG